ncbi:MAG: hypothetical protein ACTSRG_13040 [Candidatus Helarchaeota archaeon]
MRSLVTEIIPERLGPVTSDFPDASYKNEAAGVLPTPVFQQFMNCYHYYALRSISEAGITLNDLTDNITDNQQWDAYIINTKNMIFNALGISPEVPRIVSSAIRPNSSLPYFLKADGSALEFTVLGLTTNLELLINKFPVIIDTDIVKSGITAAPSTNNTTTVNDSNILNDLYAGEIDALVNEIAISAVGSEITSRIGQIAAFKTPTGEILRAFIKDATTLVNAYRGWYFDGSNDPIVRQILSDTNVLTLMNIGFVFAENDGTTIDISYTTPIYSSTAPGSAPSGDYYFNETSKEWYEGNGATWDLANVALIGEIVSDSTDTIAARSNDLSKQFAETNNIELSILSTEVVESKNTNSKINVYGSDLKIDLTKINWDITNDLESSITESINTDYYFYLSDKKEVIITSYRPYRRDDLVGYYHPYESWRCVGVAFNDASGNLVMVSAIPFSSTIKTTTAYFYHDEANGVAGGTFTGGGWRIRELSTIIDDYNMSVLDSFQVYLLPGLYEIEGIARGQEVNDHQTKIYNVDNSIDLLLGMCESSASGATNGGMSRVDGNFRIQKTIKIELQHYGDTTRSVDGFGLPCTNSDIERYATLKTKKIG